MAGRSINVLKILREIDELKAENERLREALRFYVDPWDYIHRHKLDEGTPDFYDELDTGARARQALGEDQ